MGICFHLPDSREVFQRSQYSRFSISLDGFFRKRDHFFWRFSIGSLVGTIQVNDGSKVHIDSHLPKGLPGFHRPPIGDIRTLLAQYRCCGHIRHVGFQPPDLPAFLIYADKGRNPSCSFDLVLDLRRQLLHLFRRLHITVKKDHIPIWKFA